MYTMAVSMMKIMCFENVHTDVVMQQTAPLYGAWEIRSMRACTLS